MIIYRPSIVKNYNNLNSNHNEKNKPKNDLFISLLYTMIFIIILSINSINNTSHQQH
jgi:hypothetical protein